MVSSGDCVVAMSGLCLSVVGVGERTVCCVNFAPKEDGDENDVSEDAERKERSPKSPVDRNVLVNVPVSHY